MIIWRPTPKTKSNTTTFQGSNTVRRSNQPVGHEHLRRYLPLLFSEEKSAPSREYHHRNEHVEGPGMAGSASSNAVKSVVVTGGEPLILSTSKLNSILTTLQEVESVQHIRISAKICSFNPYRILDDPGLLKMFPERCQARPGNTIWIGNHFSHPNEFTDSSREAVRLLKATGVGMLNNVPIVRGINADPDILASVFSGVLQNGHFKLLRLRPH